MGKSLGLGLRLELELGLRCVRGDGNAVTGDGATRRRRGNAQGQFGRPGTIRIAAIAWDGGLEEGNGRRRHCEIVLPVTWQKQLVGIRDCSHNGGCLQFDRERG
jgi:hypothetical protein